MYYIYRITNLINHKTYIGQHKYKKLNDSYMGSGVYLEKAKKKYGIENFKKEILVFNISKKEHIDLLEKTFIASEREKVGAENCYNITDGGEGCCGMKGKHFTEEHKRKLSEARKGRPPANKGKKMTEEQKIKLSESLKGRLAWNKRKPCHWLKGNPRPEDVRKKISEAKKGIKMTEETKKKLSEINKGHPAWNKGKQLSEEHKKKLSESSAHTFKNTHWYNNGKIALRAEECPEGFVPGRLRK